MTTSWKQSSMNKWNKVSFLYLYQNRLEKVSRITLKCEVLRKAAFTF